MIKKKAKRTRREKGVGYIYKRTADGKSIPADDTRSGTYWVRYSLNGKRVRESLGTKDQRKASSEAAKRLAPMQAADQAERASILASRAEVRQTVANQLEEDKAAPLATADAWQAYLDSESRPDSGPATLEQYAGHWKKFSLWLTENGAPPFLRGITPDLAEMYIRHLNSKKLSGDRINKVTTFMKTFFRVLGKPARMNVNPFEGITKRKHRAESKRPFTIEELKNILESAEGELQTLFYIGTFTGLRLADAATLRWSEVDLHRGIIRRIPNKTARTRGEPVIIGIPPLLAHKLAAVDRKGQFVLPETADLYASNSPALSRQIQGHLEKCGIQTIKPGTGFEYKTNDNGRVIKVRTGKRAVVQAGFHSLRHTFVSLHAHAGTSQVVLMKLAGHGNPMMTEHYVHLSEQSALKAAAALPSTFSNDEKPVRELLPDWARKITNEMTAKNWRLKKSELLEYLHKSGTP